MDGSGVWCPITGSLSFDANKLEFWMFGAIFLKIEILKFITDSLSVLVKSEIAIGGL